MANTYGGMADVFKKDIIKSQSPFTKDKDYIRQKRENANIDAISREIESTYSTRHVKKKPKLISRIVSLIVTIFITILFLGMLEILALIYMPNIGNEILYFLKEYLYPIVNVFF